MTSRALIAAVAITALACYPTTTRPAFLPLTDAPTADLKLGIPQATRAVALQLDADSVPVRRTEPDDGWLESDWFDPRTMRPTSARVLGPNVVKVRAWVDPTRPDYSHVTIETVYRPLADPSRAPRTLERQVPGDAPVMLRMTHVMTQLLHQYGDLPVDTATVPAAAASVIRKIRGTDTTHVVPPQIVKKIRLPVDTTTAPKPAAPPDSGRAAPPDRSNQDTKACR